MVVYIVGVVGLLVVGRGVGVKIKVEVGGVVYEGVFVVVDVVGIFCWWSVVFGVYC